MTYSIIFHPVAEQEYRSAYNFYEIKKGGLGKKFEEKVENRFNQIIIHPEAYSFRKKNFREVTVESFPFTIVYQLSKKNSLIFILAIFYTSRNPAEKYRQF